ncbi:type II toxin-antitoxin system VapC family toxin [Sulfuriroseicoccus oceanibius]|uniref:Type II toxin-antitoxin system VapC family toxin n=1 Tax=Sulfuriroseicoccus oceanibius TaxID=2707525 RepID=A0A6B3LB53_9BACT|nr:type II toxin-antitoxin system VapC family toxin [Sulfuriroseicoccus oceanibius]QQL45883.1 type II toxin-antitoxin system VapC family toxin [Sulfuriroseicoccus oceanibius]
MNRVLADTNIWCDFFSGGDSTLAHLLEYDLLLTHTLVIGELAVGNLPKRRQTLADLQQLPQMRSASFHETLTFINHHQLYGRGLQWNDLLILASVIAAPGVLLWTRDRRLGAAAAEFNVAFDTPQHHSK